MMRERTPSTHLLTIEIPLNLAANPAAESYDIEGAMAQALKAILPMVQLGTLGLLCDHPQVTMKEAGT